MSWSTEPFRLGSANRRREPRTLAHGHVFGVVASRIQLVGN